MSDYVKNPYADLDALILDALNGRAITFSALSIIPRIEEEANRVAKPTRVGFQHGWRVVDRRLQALRKSGKIKVSRARGWERV